jgi:hypothetical protein
MNMRCSRLFLIVLVIGLTGFARTATAGEIEVKLSAADNPRRITLEITNKGKTELRLPHPSNRMAMCFFVTDDLGNQVQPVGRAKVDPATLEITIPAGETYTHKMSDFEFLTGSALFGFELKHAATYRVVAVYRPDPRTNLGVSSPEAPFTVK